MNLHLIRLVYAKEMRETLRDRRTLMVMILLPLVLYPLVIFAIGQGLQFSESKRGEQPSRVLLPGEPWPELEQALRKSKEPVEVKPLASTRSGKATPGQGREGAIGPEEQVRQELADLVLWVPAGYQKQYKGQDTVKLRLVYDETNDRSSLALKRVKEVLRGLEDQIRRQRFSARGLPLSLSEPLHAKVRSIASSRDIGAHVLSRVIPLLAVLMVLLGAFYPAIDLTAGEKERGTLETLLAAPVSRTPLIAGKFLVVVSVATFTGLLNMGSLGLTFSLGLRGGLEKAGAVLEVPWSAVALTCLAILPAAFFFSAVMVAVAALARSFKEAQNLLTPVYMVCMMPAILAMFPWVELTPFTALIPAVNVGLLARELIAGELPVTALVLCLISSLVYTLVALKAAAMIYNSERMLFAPDTRGGKGKDKGKDGRPPAPAPPAGSSPEPIQAAILLLVVMGLILLVGQSLQARDLISGLLVTEWVFIAAPALLLVRIARLDPRSVLGLNAARPINLAGVVLAGLSGWFVVGVLVESLQQRVMPIPKELMEAMTRMLFSTERHLLLDLFALAVSPAICEELLFRGVLLRASRNTLKPLPAVALNALLFGVFHMSIYRFFPTMMLGLVLSLIALRAGSIYPAMIFHLLNNACAILAGKFLGLSSDGSELLTGHYIITGVVVFAGGMFLATRKRGGVSPRGGSLHQ